MSIAQDKKAPGATLASYVAAGMGFAFGFIIIAWLGGSAIYEGVRWSNQEGACYSGWGENFEPRYANGQCSILQEGNRIPASTVNTYTGVKSPEPRENGW